MSGYKFRFGVVAFLAFASLGAAGQTGYKPPKPYGSNLDTPAVAGSSGSQSGGNQQSGATPPPAGRPAPSAPMPSPLPNGVDKVQSALDQSLPMTPNEIRKLMSELLERQAATQENATGRLPAKPVTSQEQIDLSPGATPPVVRVAMGQGAILSFADSAGRPWPIADDRSFNTRAYEVRLIGPHLYSVNLLKREQANVAVVLKGLARPVIITVQPAADETDYLKEYTIPKFLDDTPPPAVAASSREGAFSFNSPELLNYLYRTPPKGARALTVAGLPGVMAWQSAPNKMVVRTAGQVVIPAFSRRHGSTDGVTVFELPLSPIVSITEGGALHRISIGDYVVDTKK